MRDVTRFIDGSDYATKRRSKGILRFKSTKTGFCFLKKSWPFRLLSPFDTSLRLVAIAIISVYQRHLSPRKGYSCAHRILHGGDSCSEYVKNVLADKSLFESTLIARQRFRECNIAYISVKNRVVESKGSVMRSVGPDDFITLIIGIIISIITAILAFIFGKKCDCK
ncbi:membrane protein insertion efficiency factor YidD [Nostoc sp. TCL240-02]|uniref:membrane protein insertion efficiency factor YidD n=1 Tax=Nostoc sp. TCL240-02 TaxID=2572090 RepID=UPI00157FAB51|nr:membrane protein insertion efficiency factor YidD [Nostoc sp. TCL240-02]QKQ74206.1 membrane protein insertion efficiency factor YidD [Nostoc sp. TCL240-02]